MLGISATVWALQAIYINILFFAVDPIDLFSVLRAAGILKYSLSSSRLGFVAAFRRNHYKCRFTVASTTKTTSTFGMSEQDDASNPNQCISIISSTVESNIQQTEANKFHQRCFANFTDEYLEIVDEFGDEAYGSAKDINSSDTTYGSESHFIRIEKEKIDPCHSKEYVLSRIYQVQTEQNRYGKSELYNRHWSVKQQESHVRDALSDNVNGSSQNTNGVMGGHRKDMNYERDLSHKTIAVAQFNLLAEGLSSGPNVKTPFVVNQRSMDRVGQYGGFSSIQHRDVALDFNQRKWRLLEVILGSDGTAQFDLVALEEIDRFYGFFKPVMKLFGYDGVFTPKKNSRGVGFGFYSDGCCLFWRSSMFDLVSFNSYDYSIGNHVLLVVTLQHKPSQMTILVAVTHLKAQKGESNERIRQIQVKELLKHVDSEKLQLVQSKSEFHEKHQAILLLGDLNADPPGINTEFSVSSIRTILEYASSEYHSAYDIDPPEKSFHTSWKKRGKDTTKRIIDYIFYRGSLKCTAILHVPDDREMEETKLPGLRYPSDHLLIAAHFELES